MDVTRFSLEMTWNAKTVLKAECTGVVAHSIIHSALSENFTAKTIADSRPYLPTVSRVVTMHKGETIKSGFGDETGRYSFRLKCLRDENG